MKKLLLFALPLVAMLSVSCEKDNNKPYSGPTKLVKEIYAADGPFMKFEYDNDGRVSTLNVGGGNFYTYEYSDNEIVISSDNDKTTFTLDADGYITKEVDEYSDGGEVSIRENKYEYKDGYLSKIDNDSDFEQVFVWKDGNVYPSYVELEYSNIVNITNIELSVILGTGCPHLNYIRHKGLSSNNLVKSAKSEGIAYQYKLDNDGAPIQMSVSCDGEVEATYTIKYVE